MTSSVLKAFDRLLTPGCPPLPLASSLGSDTSGWCPHQCSDVDEQVELPLPNLRGPGECTCPRHTSCHLSCVPVWRGDNLFSHQRNAAQWDTSTHMAMENWITDVETWHSWSSCRLPWKYNCCRKLTLPKLNIYFMQWKCHFNAHIYIHIYVPKSLLQKYIQKHIVHNNLKARVIIFINTNIPFGINLVNTTLDL